MAKQYHVTNLTVNPGEDRAHRMKIYFIAMSLRFLCVFSLFFVRGWWLLLPVLGAVLLPYFAVMIGNAIAGAQEGSRIQPRMPLSLQSGVDSSARAESEKPKVIVIEQEEEQG